LSYLVPMEYSARCQFGPLRPTPLGSVPKDTALVLPRQLDQMGQETETSHAPRGKLRGAPRSEAQRPRRTAEQPTWRQGQGNAFILA